MGAHLVHRLKRVTERALAEARAREVGRPEQVWVAEDELDGRWRLSVPSLGRCVGVGGADDAARAEDVEGDLDIEGPVTRVVEDEDGRDRSLGEVYCL